MRKILISVWVLMVAGLSYAQVIPSNPIATTVFPTLNAAGATFMSADYAVTNSGTMEAIIWDGPNQGLAYSVNGGTPNMVPFVTHTNAIGRPVVKIVNLKKGRDIVLVAGFNDPTHGGLYFETYVWNGSSFNAGVGHASGGTSLTQRTTAIAKNEMGQFVIVADHGTTTATTKMQVRGGYIDLNTGNLVIGGTGNLQYIDPNTGSVGDIYEPTVALDYSGSSKEFPVYYGFVDTNGQSVVTAYSSNQNIRTPGGTLFKASTGNVLYTTPTFCAGGVSGPSISLNTEQWAAGQMGNSPLGLMAYIDNCPGAPSLNSIFFSANAAYPGGFITVHNSGSQAGATINDLTAIANVGEFAGMIVTKYSGPGYINDALHYGLEIPIAAGPYGWTNTAPDFQIGNVAGTTDAVTSVQIDNDMARTYFIENGVVSYKDNIQMNAPKY